MAKQIFFNNAELLAGLTNVDESITLGQCVFITGRRSIAPFLDDIKDTFKIKKHIVVKNSNPTDEDIKELLDDYQLSAKDTVLVIGGGSVIDVAKIYSFFSCNEHRFGEKADKEKQYEMPTLVAVPTTCGTGSESTQFATYYIDKIKHSLDHACVIPGHVLLCEEPLANLPEHIWGNTLSDALCQAIESYWNVNSNSVSQAYSEDAISMLLGAISEKNLAKAIKGSNLAGRAIQITRTTAPHAISYPMTSHFDIPHGQAVAISLPAVFYFNYYGKSEVTDSRGEEYIKKNLEQLAKILGCSEVGDAITLLERTFLNLGLKRRLSELGVHKDDHAVILDQGFNPDRVKNNPRLITRSDLAIILESIA
jgi:alcohol dehydrogenase class IV